MSAFLKLQFLPVFVFFAAFPFFEGLNTSSGLFLAQSLVLVSLLHTIFFYRRIWLPPHLSRFIPFLLVLILSTIIAPYKYSAFLRFLDYWIAAFFAIFVYSFLRENEDDLENVAFITFVLATIATLASVLLIPNPYRLRWKGSFVNPTDFGIFCLLLFVFGLFCFERASSTQRKVVASSCLVFLMISVAMASSRAVFLATSIILVYYLWKKRASRLVSAILIAALIGSAAVVYVRFFHFSDPFQYYRLKIWKYSLQGILQDPYLGIGLNMLPFRASQFNFPADQEVGRYSRIATSADNQYLQILIETGFLGFFLFLIGWLGLYFGLRKIPARFLAFQGAYIVVTITSFFALPLNTTSILYLFLFLILFPLPFDPETKLQPFKPPLILKALIALIFCGVFIFAIYFPYRADREFNAYLNSQEQSESDKHLRNAMRLNPYQPYYGFTAIRRIVDNRLQLEPSQWLVIAKNIDRLIKLNPLESDFYTYKAKIFRILMERTGNSVHYTDGVTNYQLAIQHAPYNVFLRAEYGFFEYKAVHLDRAEEEMIKILKLEPVFLNSRLLLAEILFKRGNVEAAKIQFKEFERLQQQHASLKYSVNEPYVRKLIQVDESYKNSVKKLIFDVPKPEAP